MFELSYFLAVVANVLFYSSVFYIDFKNTMQKEMNCIFMNKLLQGLIMQTDEMTTCIKVELWPTTYSTQPWKLTLSTTNSTGSSPGKSQTDFACDNSGNLTLTFVTIS